MKFINFLINPKIYLPVIYIIIGIISFALIRKIIVTVFKQRKRLSVKNNKKYNTLMQVIIDCIKIIIIFLVVLSILSLYGIDVKAALAGLGIISVLIGLAFQDLFKDVIVGFSIIVEDYFSVGDTIEVAGFKGEVLHIGIKSTKIKRFDGPVMIISNRNIDKVINYTTTNSLAIVEIPVAYEENIEEVEKVLNNLFKKLSKELEHLQEDIQIWGVEELGDSAVVIKVAVKTDSLEQFDIQRKIRKAVKQEFDKKEIKIPYTQIEVHNGK